jgi:hypothetical protein
MESRLARLEGAYEQIDHRLTDLRQDVIGLRQEMLQGNVSLRQDHASLRQDYASLRQEMVQRFNAVDHKFTWLIGTIVGTWITTMLAILFHHP